jgi:basic membrane lipoprotein Med (substrate-binding protein (PBP1-ABC) superfamily)
MMNEKTIKIPISMVRRIKFAYENHISECENHIKICQCEKEKLDKLLRGDIK